VRTRIYAWHRALLSLECQKKLDCGAEKEGKGTVNQALEKVGQRIMYQKRDMQRNGKGKKTRNQTASCLKSLLADRQESLCHKREGDTVCKKEAIFLPEEKTTAETNKKKMRS